MYGGCRQSLSTHAINYSESQIRHCLGREGERIPFRPSKVESFLARLFNSYSSTFCSFTVLELVMWVCSVRGKIQLSMYPIEEVLMFRPNPNANSHHRSIIDRVNNVTMTRGEFEAPSSRSNINKTCLDIWDKLRELTVLICHILSPWGYPTQSWSFRVSTNCKTTTYNANPYVRKSATEVNDILIHATTTLDYFVTLNADG